MNNLRQNGMGSSCYTIQKTRQKYEYTEMNYKDMVLE